MYKLIRFYNQNRKKIFKIILIIVLIIGLIQLLNYFAKNPQNKGNIQQGNIITINNRVNDELVSDKSIISGQSVGTTKLKEDKDIIKQFVEDCNNEDISSAYKLLTNETKELMFPTLQDFYNIYYMPIFNQQKKIYTIENWNASTYQVRFTEDILATGRLNGGETKQDYITVAREDGQYKLNINSYIGRKNRNKKTEYKDIVINVTSIDQYMDYEVYNLSIKNNSGNSILLDTSNDIQSIYLLDDNDTKYYFYNNEVIENKLIVESQFINNLQIKFNNSFTSSRTIRSLVFSKLVLNYDEYKEIENKDNYEFYNYIVNV